MVGVEFDFSDVDDAFDLFNEEIKSVMTEAGKKGVSYAKEHGDYQDITGTLRKSNTYEVEMDGLVLKNNTEYASYVEAKGFDVLGSAVLEVEKFLKENCE